MPLLDIVQDVCAVVGVEQLQSVFSGLTASRTQQEMLALANEMAQRIAYDVREWTKLKLVMTMTGDGVATSFPLPANYKRLLLTADIWRSSTPSVPMRFIPDLNEWMQRRARNYYDSRGEWTMYGGAIAIAPVMGVGINATTVYLDNSPIKLSTSAPPGQLGARFMADTDTYRLDERLLKLGMIWQWKANKGSPYAEDMGTFSDALAMLAGSDAPAPIMVDGVPVSTAATIAYPGPMPSSTDWRWPFP